MFDDIHFTGTINLGNLFNALVFLIGAITLYFRVKAKIKEYELKQKDKPEKPEPDQPDQPDV